ncbi:tRNA-specific adenosine deaminase subunit tad3 [Diplonema papillatum]|nr:tRNA-specific adenosine deaminase subunit tad3 [Diplonema papillatum]
MDAGSREAAVNAIREIVSPEAREPTVPTRLAWVGTVEDKHASKALTMLSKARPLKDLNAEFIRRIVRNRESNRLEIVYGGDQAGAAEAGLTALRQVRIPQRFPATPEQWRWCSETVWPLSKPAPPPSPTLPANMSDASLSYVKDNWRRLLQHTESHPDSAACILIHPATNELIATCSGGSGAASAYMLAQPPPALCDPLDHCTMRLISKVAAVHKTRAEHTASKTRSKSDQYLLSGLDLFITEEPCVMCSMALLHSRVGRVFFLYPNTKFGGLVQRTIHCHPGLNHHYPTYHLLDPKVLAACDAEAAAT